MDVHPKRSAAIVAPRRHNSASISLNRNGVKQHSTFGEVPSARMSRVDVLEERLSLKC